MRMLISIGLVLSCCFTVVAGEARPPIYLWLEPEWFEGVEGSFAYWPGKSKATGAWGIAGPGISAEWSQGGESEWNSMGAAAEETRARCRRDFVVPRAGTYKIWVRYVDHRRKSEPFRVTIDQGGKPVFNGEYGSRDVVPPGDEYQLFWGFSFGWDGLEAKLAQGPARVHLIIDKPGEGWRQVDALLLTDDLTFVPSGRQKPRFAYQTAVNLMPKAGERFRGAEVKPPAKADWKHAKLAGRDFSMWAGIDPNPKWWAMQDLAKLSLYDVFFQFSPPYDIRDKFHKQFAGQKDVPIMSWPGLLPGFHLGPTPDFSPGTPLRQWFESTKTPFYIMTNYATGKYDDKTGPATYQALTGPLAGQFLGYIHGEAIGTQGVSMPDKALGKTRRQHVDALAKHLREQQAAAWTKIYKTPVPPEHWAKGIPCLSVDSISLAHLFHDMGAATVGYEIDATNVHVPMRIAFERGAARQYRGAWINYASSNFGDACNYFTQQPVVPRGAGAWFHSKYSITDGVSIAWYRRLYYLNYLSGASAIYWEQSLNNQWILPGPGTHPIQLSPFGRATTDFQAFVDRLPERGEPLTPIGLLLSYGHGYERVNYRCKMLHTFSEDKNDLELRELFNVCWHPSAVLEGLPASPDVQSMPGGIYGNIFDVLVDRPARAKAISPYPVIWAAGDVDLSGPWLPVLKDYVHRGGTLVVNVAAAKDLPQELLGIRLTDKKVVAASWVPEGSARLACTPYELLQAEPAGATVLAWALGALSPREGPGGVRTPLLTRHQVGQGAVIVTLVPRLLGQDERAHPALPFLMNGITAGLLPVEVRLADGKRPAGEIMFQINKTKEGYLVMLMNQRGIDKTQTGIARVDRRAFVDVTLTCKFPLHSAKEYTDPRDLEIVATKTAATVTLRVHPGDVQVVALTAKPGGK